MTIAVAVDQQRDLKCLGAQFDDSRINPFNLEPARLPGLQRRARSAAYNKRVAAWVPL